MTFFLLAGAITLLGVTPLAVTRRIALAIVFAVLVFLITWALLYLNTPDTVGPLYGAVGVYVTMIWLILGGLALFMSIPQGGVSVAMGVAALLIATGISFFTGPIFNAPTFANKIGPIETRVWTSDIQPKDTHQMRIVSENTARYIASKAVSQAGSIGSQFHPDFDHLTLQQRKGRMFYAVPLDYNGYAVWSSTPGTPGWIEIDAQDPELPARYVSAGEQKLAYMPNAYFGQNLERHLREAGVRERLGTPLFMVDDAGKPRWVYIAYVPSQGFKLDEIASVIEVDPATGTIVQHAPDKVPESVDIVYKSSLVKDRLDYHGEYAGGWWNAFWAKVNIEGVDSITLVAGNDGRLVWVSGISQPHRNNDALVAMIYTDVVTGKSVRYQIPGGATDEGIIRAVNANPDVKFRHLRAQIPQTYNVEGVMTAMVPLVTEVGASQGIAFAEIANPQDVAYGATQEAALNAYKMLLLRRGQQVSLETAHGFVDITGTIERIAFSPLPDRGVEFTLQGRDRIYTASANDYVGLSLARPGDSVTLKTVESASTVLPVRQFTNQSLPLHQSGGERSVKAEAIRQQDAEIGRTGARDIKARIDALTPEQIEALQKQIPAKP